MLESVRTHRPRVAKTFIKATNTVGVGGKAKTLFGMQYGQHQIKTVPASQLVSIAL